MTWGTGCATMESDDPVSWSGLALVSAPGTPENTGKHRTMSKASYAASADGERCGHWFSIYLGFDLQRNSVSSQILFAPQSLSLMHLRQIPLQ